MPERIIGRSFMDLETYQKQLFELAGTYEAEMLHYAEAKQVYHRLEDLKKVKIAQIKDVITHKYPSMTDTKASTFALTTVEYKQFLQHLDKARGLYYELFSKKDAIYNKMQALITLISVEKTKMGLL